MPWKTETERFNKPFCSWSLLYSILNPVRLWILCISKLFSRNASLILWKQQMGCLNFQSSSWTATSGNQPMRWDWPKEYNHQVPRKDWAKSWRHDSTLIWNEKMSRMWSICVPIAKLYLLPSVCVWFYIFKVFCSLSLPISKEGFTWRRCLYGIVSSFSPRKKN